MADTLLKSTTRHVRLFTARVNDGRLVPDPNQLTKAFLNGLNAAFVPKEFVIWIQVESELIGVCDQPPVIHSSCE